MTQIAIPIVCLVCAGASAALLAATSGAEPARHQYWNAPDRAARVAALIPGRRVPKLTPDMLFAEWTKQQVDSWNREHPPLAPEEAYRRYAAMPPTDAEIETDFPVHISPFGRVRSGRPDPEAAAQVLITYCPFCRSRTLSLQFDADNPYRAQTSCCHTRLYGREQDCPPGYALRSNATARFLHLDDTWHEVPCTLYRDSQGVEWELFIKTLFDHKRWVDQGCDLVKEYGERFRETANPLYAHKIAVLLDKVADTYYGLPLCHENTLCQGRDGRPLTRAEWEAVPRPAIFETSYLGPWSRRLPLSSKGWLNMFDEQIWVEPFARVRHHPAFRTVSQVKYGDPDALDHKVMTRLLRELSLMFQSVFAQKLLHNYQEANYARMWILGVLLQDPVLLNFAGPCQELTMYNHTYQDGLNGEGAPNYMDMPGSYYYPYLRDPKGWLEFYPRFLEDNPFCYAASREMARLKTLRGLELEFGDQHEMAFSPAFLVDPAQVAECERIGSRNWAGYGVGVVRVGGPGHRQEVSLSYTRATLHNAQDALSMECWVDGVPVMRRGGYAAWWSNAHLAWDRPEYQALLRMGYPHRIVEGERSFDGWSWVWAHSPLCQNGVTVDETATGKGWGDNRGYGETLTFKGGETAGEPGSGFQVLDVQDHYSWARVGKRVSGFRRTLIGIEGPPTGAGARRPYVLDMLALTGGQRHALYNSAWAERAGARLPHREGLAADLRQVFFAGRKHPDNSHTRNFTRVRRVELLAPPRGPWSVTWKTDYAAYAPRDPDGKPFRRPLPDNAGQVRLRLLGLPQTDGATRLLRGKGPWIGWLRQPLPGGQRADGNVAFLDARDFLIEARTGRRSRPLDSLFVHVLEGYREGEESAIRSVTRLNTTNLRGPRRRVLALRVAASGGHTDTIIYQSAPGWIRLPDGTQTDARYALLRRDRAGRVIEADACRATTLTTRGFGASLPGDFTGTIVDVIGDLTGTRTESALIIRPDRPWPTGTNLKDRQLLIRIVSRLRAPCNEGYRVQRVTRLPGGLVRVDLQDYAPFVVSWHEVAVLPPDRPNVLRTNRPLVDHGNTPWYRGLNIWFPERGKSYTIRRVNEVGGGYGGDTVELLGPARLAADGIRPGDWFVVYAVRPGLRVTVANDFCWRREPASGWRQYSLRATGPVRVRCADMAGPVSYRPRAGAWRHSWRGRDRLDAAAAGDRWITAVAGRPGWLDLRDTSPPALARIALDGRALKPPANGDLGWIEPPRSIVLEFRDRHNPLDASAARVTLDGRLLPASAGGPVQAALTSDGKGLALTVDLARATGTEAQPRRHQLRVVVPDRSVDRHQAAIALTYIARVPVDAAALYLSDLKPLRSFAHAGLITDRNYLGGVAEMAGRIYPKCVMLCPEPSPEGEHGEAVYQLPSDRGAPTLKADVGLEASASSYGSVVFAVQVAEAPGGPWRALYTSPVLRGGEEPLAVAVPLGPARYLRLYTTDAGDGINSDHALWGGARLVFDGAGGTRVP